MNLAVYCFVFMTVVINVLSATTRGLHLKEGLLPENSSGSLENLENYDEAESFAHQRMARHIELKRPSINSIVQNMKNGLTTYERDRKHNFVNMVFKKLTKKIQDGVNRPRNDLGFSLRSNTTEESSSEDDIDDSDNYLDSSENISD